MTSLSGQEWTMAGFNHAKTLVETACVHNRCELSNFVIIYKLEFVFKYTKDRRIYLNVITYILLKTPK